MEKTKIIIMAIDNKPKGDKHFLAEKLAIEEANSNAKAYPNLPVGSDNNPISNRNHWTPTHGHGARSPLTKVSEISHDKRGIQRADPKTLSKGTGPVHNVEGRAFQIHNYVSGQGPTRSAFMAKPNAIPSKIGNSTSLDSRSSPLKSQSTSSHGAASTGSSGGAAKTSSPSTSSTNTSNKGQSR